jgi:hypothetical protein
MADVSPSQNKLVYVSFGAFMSRSNSARAAGRTNEMSRYVRFLHEGTVAAGHHGFPQQHQRRRVGVRAGEQHCEELRCAAHVLPFGVLPGAAISGRLFFPALLHNLLVNLHPDRFKAVSVGIAATRP